MLFLLFYLENVYNRGNGERKSIAKTGRRKQDKRDSIN